MNVSQMYYRIACVAHTVTKLCRRILVKVQGLLQVAPAVYVLRACAVWPRGVPLLPTLDSLAFAGMRTARITLEIRPLPHGFRVL